MFLMTQLLLFLIQACLLEALDLCKFDYFIKFSVFLFINLVKLYLNFFMSLGYRCKNFCKFFAIFLYYNKNRYNVN